MQATIGSRRRCRHSPTGTTISSSWPRRERRLTASRCAEFSQADSRLQGLRTPRPLRARGTRPRATSISASPTTRCDAEFRTPASPLAAHSTASRPACLGLPGRTLGCSGRGLVGRRPDPKSPSTKPPTPGYEMLNLSLGHRVFAGRDGARVDPPEPQSHRRRGLQPCVLHQVRRTPPWKRPVPRLPVTFLSRAKEQLSFTAFFCGHPGWPFFVHPGGVMSAVFRSRSRTQRHGRIRGRSGSGRQRQRAATGAEAHPF